VTFATLESLQMPQPRQFASCARPSSCVRLASIGVYAQAPWMGIACSAHEGNSCLPMPLSQVLATRFMRMRVHTSVILGTIQCL
jgi:hypothetical protein